MSTSQDDEFSPAQDLPYELLGEIFQLCLPYQPSLDVFAHIEEKYHDSTAAKLPIQMTLASVCRKWRHASLACKSLWNVLSINVKANGVTEPAAFVRMWLERSGDGPLFIRVGYIQYFPDDNGQLAAVLEALCEVSARWKVLDLHIPIKYFPHLQQPEQNHQGLTAPVLEVLTIYTVPPPGEPRSSYAPGDFTPIGFGPGSTPQLKRLVNPHLRLKHLGLDYAQLTEVSAANMRIADCLELLQLAPNLVSANLQPPVIHRESIPANLRHVTHAKFQTLSFVHPLFTFWDCTTLPSLEKLVLDYRAREPYLPHFQFQSLLNFARRGRRNIKRLEIVNSYSFDEQTFMELLAELLWV